MIVAESIVNVRKAPSFDSEVVSQSLIGEKLSILKEKDQFAEVSLEDGYSGWVPSFVCVDAKYTPNLFTCRKAVPVFGETAIEKGPVNLLPFGVGLEANLTGDWFEVRFPSGDMGYIQKGNLSEKRVLSKDELLEFSKQFLDIPYIWGGRSSFGYDCSGFIQMLYKQIGTFLPRDASLQINAPGFSEVQEPSPGDLIFWGTSREKIQHVGLYLGGNEFIHATNREGMPWLRISCLSDRTWNPETSSKYSCRQYRSL